jgi:hypothetical protein
MKAIKGADLRDLTDAWDRNELSYSKMVELINEKADNFAIGFGEYLDSLTYQDMGELTIKQLLETYKEEKGL